TFYAGRLSAEEARFVVTNGSFVLYHQKKAVDDESCELYVAYRSFARQIYHFPVITIERFRRSPKLRVCYGDPLAPEFRNLTDLVA
uniref:EVE domain-containing protein n=1 Tax=Steinernema glaseri TaxID=37863 RepID=A0A1I8AWV9_9BILA